MKHLFFVINVILAIALLGAVAGNTVLKKDQNAVEYSVKKASPQKSTAAKTSAKRSAQTTLADQESTIVKKNIFNPSRNPNPQQAARTVNQSQMALVGVCMVGNTKGAVILQRTRNNRPFGPGMRPGQNWNNQNNWNNRNNWNNWNNRNQQQQAVQQYVRIGEKLSNGYILTEVTRTGAVLTLNGARMELKLQEPSKNQTQTARRTGRAPTAQQQMLMMQRMQMMQNMQMMRMIQQNNRNQGYQYYQNNNPGANRNIQNTGNRGGSQTNRRR